jgi:hypothetical protein
MIKLPFPSLLGELKNYSSNLKAKRIYWLCLKNGKNEIALRIKKKYNLTFPSDDTVDSFRYALLASFRH